MRRRWLGLCWKPLLGPAEVQRWQRVMSFTWLGGGACENFLQELMFEVSLERWMRACPPGGQWGRILNKSLWMWNTY